MKCSQTGLVWYIPYRSDVPAFSDCIFANARPQEAASTADNKFLGSGCGHGRMRCGECLDVHELEQRQFPSWRWMKLGEKNEENELAVGSWDGMNARCVILHQR